MGQTECQAPAQNEHTFGVHTPEFTTRFYNDYLRRMEADQVQLQISDTSWINDAADSFGISYMDEGEEIGICQIYMHINDPENHPEEANFTLMWGGEECRDEDATFEREHDLMRKVWDLITEIEVPKYKGLKDHQYHNTGGGCMVDTFMLENGVMATMTSECVVFYDSHDMNDFWDHEEDAQMLWLEMKPNHYGEPDHDTTGAFKFDYHGTEILQPYRDETDRFDVRPLAYYGQTFVDELVRLSSECLTDDVVDSIVDRWHEKLRTWMDDTGLEPMSLDEFLCEHAEVLEDHQKEKGKELLEQFENLPSYQERPVAEEDPDLDQMSELHAAAPELLDILRDVMSHEYKIKKEFTYAIEPYSWHERAIEILGRFKDIEAGGES